MPCVSSGELISGCDPTGRCRPSRIPRNLGEQRSLLAVWCRMPLWGHDCPLPALAALAGLSLAGYGLAHSQLALLSPLFHEHAWRCLQFSSVAQSCPTICDPMNCSLPGLPVHHKLLEFTQTHAHPVSDATQPSHPLSSPSPPASSFPNQETLTNQLSNPTHWVKPPQ